MKRTGPTNIHLRKLITQLHKQKALIWQRVGNELARSTRQRRAVNLSRINRCTKAGDVVLVPGKVLSGGSLGHKLTIAAWQVSVGAAKKIEAAGGQILTIQELLAKSPRGSKIKLIG